MVDATKRDIETILNKRWRMEHLYAIRGEDRKIHRLSFSARPVQEYLFAHAESKGHRGIRAINLKSRKLGVTSFWSAYYLDDTMFSPNTMSCIIAHKREDVHKIFRIVKLMYRSCPDSLQLESGKVWYKPQASYDNVGELIFNSINSGIYVALESRGDTNNNLHISEAAHIPRAEDRMAATMESVPNREFGSNITIETTANGVGGWFHDEWTAAEEKHTEFDPLFFPWFFDPKNSLSAPDDFYPNKEEEQMIAKVAERFNMILTPSQVFWWRQKKAGRRRLMNQEQPTFPEDAFLSSEGMVFEEDAMRAINPVDAPFELIIGKHHVKIWEQPKPGRRYATALDPSEGAGGGDNSAIETVDAVTLRQVAEFVDPNISPADAGRLAVDVAIYFNKCVLAIERNNHGHAAIEAAKKKKGANLYCERKFDEKTNKKTRKIGWLTTAHTRDLILDEFEDLVDDGTFKPRSAILKNEMLSFVLNKDGRREAKTGKHDDTIMASAIAIKVARLPQKTFDIFDLS